MQRFFIRFAVLSLLGFGLIASVILTCASSIAYAAPKNTPFTWDNATVYFVLTDRFYDGEPKNNHSYGRELDRSGKPYPGYQNKVGTFHGGDLRGLTKKLNEGYFSDLGVNAIWITSPIEQIHGWIGGLNFRHYAYHGYYALDFTELDANMGTRQDLRTFIDTAHSKGIRVLFDVVMNHAGYPDMKSMDDYQFGSLNPGWEDYYYDQPESEAHYTPYNQLIDTGNASRWTRWWGSQWIRMPSNYAGYEPCTGGELTACLADLPDFKTDSTESVELPTFLEKKWGASRLAQENQELNAFFKRTGKARTPANHMIKWITDWVREYGVDGFRIDTAKHVQLSVWKDLKTEAVKALREWKTKNPTKKLDDLDFWMVGEVWGAGLGKNQYFTDGGFDALINFGFKDVPNNIQNIDGIFAQYATSLNSDPAFNVLSYISSHDTSLYNRSNLLNGGTALLLSPGAVQIYYGDETGRKPDSSPWDQPTRTQMNWSSIDQNLLAHWRKLGQFRNRHLAIGAGEHKKMQDAPYAFSRTYDKNGYDDAVVVALGAQGTVSINVAGVFEDGDKLKDYYSGKSLTVDGDRVSVDAHVNGVVLLEKIGAGKPRTRAYATPAGGDFTDDSLALTLNLANVSSGKYTLNGSSPKTAGITFKNGDQITIGKQVGIGQTVTLRLYASGSLGEVAQTYKFTKQKKPEGLAIYFKKPANWGEPQLYYYGVQPAGIQPVTWNTAPTMKVIGNDWYEYTIPVATAATVMFKDGKGNQIPGKNQPGISRQTAGSFDGSKWTNGKPDGTQESSTTKPVSKPKPVVSSKPTEPAKLFYSNLSRAAVTIGWSASKDNGQIIGYYLYRDGRLHAFVPGRTSFKDDKMTIGKVHTYNVRAIDDSGNVSASTKILKISVPGTIVSKSKIPTAPAKLLASKRTGSTVTLSWSPSTDNIKIIGYHVYRDGQLHAFVKTTTSFRDGSLRSGKTYSYTIRAIDNEGNLSAASPLLKV